MRGALLRQQAAQLSAIRDLHRPSTGDVEVEQWHEDWENCPDEDGCKGHYRLIKICEECGTGTDAYGEPAWSEWPCRTARALGMAE